MRIVEPKAEIVTITPHCEEVIEVIGRTMYRERSASGSASGFIRKCKNSRTWDVFTHVHATIRFITDALTAFRFQEFDPIIEESGVYDYTIQGFECIRPLHLIGNEYLKWEQAMLAAELAYKGLTHDAHMVLPFSIAHTMVLTLNFKQWRELIECKNIKHNRAGIRLCAQQAQELLIQFAPTVFEDLVQ